MAAGDTSLSICSDALLMLGARQISAFDEGTDEATICNRLYPNVRDSTLLAYPWSFSFKKVQLTRTVNSPVNEWKYEYFLPPDRIGLVRRVFNSTAVGAVTHTEWMILGEKLLTNQETVVVDYQFSTLESAMPAYFVQLLKYMMAWHLAAPVTDQESKAAYWQSVAVGSPAENNRGGYMRTAMMIDGQGNTTPSFDDFTLTAVRF